MNDDALWALRTRLVSSIHGGRAVTAEDLAGMLELAGIEADRRAQHAESLRGAGRDVLGRLVRHVWLRWAHEQPDAAAHTSWTLPYDEIDERDREVDRRIGEELTVAARDGWEPTERATQRLDAAYLDRDRVLALLAAFAASAGHRAGIGFDSDPAVRAPWNRVLFIDLPTGQVSWHIHERNLPLFDGLDAYDAAWDGHDLSSKFARVAAMVSRLMDFVRA